MEFEPKRLLSDNELGEFYALIEKYGELQDQWENAKQELIECQTWIVRCIDFFGIHNDICPDVILEDYHFRIKEYDSLKKKIRIFAKRISRIRSELIRLSQ